MKIRLTIVSFAIATALTAALAQVPPPTPIPATAPAPAANPAPPQFPVGGTDNISDGDTVIGPDYSTADEMRANPAWATGELHQFVMHAKDSKIYPGRKRKPSYQADTARSPGGRGNAVPGDVQWVDAPYEPRPVWVYIPAGTNPRTPMPVIMIRCAAPSMPASRRRRFHRW